MRAFQLTLISTILVLPTSFQYEYTTGTSNDLYKRKEWAQNVTKLIKYPTFVYRLEDLYNFTELSLQTQSAGGRIDLSTVSSNHVFELDDLVIEPTFFTPPIQDKTAGTSKKSESKDSKRKKSTSRSPAASKSKAKVKQSQSQSQPYNPTNAHPTAFGKDEKIQEICQSYNSVQYIRNPCEDSNGSFIITGFLSSAGISGASTDTGLEDTDLSKLLAVYLSSYPSITSRKVKIILSNRFSGIYKPESKIFNPEIFDIQTCTEYISNQIKTRALYTNFGDLNTDTYAAIEQPLMISMDYKSYVPNISFNGGSSKYKPDKSVADTEITQVDYSSNKKSATDNVYSPGNSIKPGNALERRNSDESIGASADKAEVVKDNKSIAGETENIDSNASTTRTQLEQVHSGSKYGNGQLDLNFINSNKKSQVITISEIITLAKENEKNLEADKKTTTTYAFDVKTPSSKAKSTAGTADKINPSMDSTLSTPLPENFSYFLFEENKNIEIISDPLPVFKKTTTVGNKQEDSAKQSTPEQENVIPFYIYKSKHSIKIGSGLVLQTELKNHISLDFNTSDDFETLSNLFLNSFEKTVTAENKTVDLAHLKSLALNNVPPVNYIGMSTFGAGSTSFSNGVVYCNVRDDLFT